MSAITQNFELGKGRVQIAHALSVETPGGPQNLNCVNHNVRTKRA